MLRKTFCWIHLPRIQSSSNISLQIDKIYPKQFTKLKWKGRGIFYKFVNFSECTEFLANYGQFQNINRATHFSDSVESWARTK